MVTHIRKFLFGTLIVAHTSLALAISAPQNVKVDGVDPTSLPTCDFTIKTAADWSHVNDLDKRVICVAPAPTYTYEEVGVINLSASGTADKPRWLRWDRSDNAHPANVPTAETAALSQFDLKGNYWVVDRIAIRDAIYQPSVYGSNNTLQRMLFEKPRDWADRNTGVMLVIFSGSDNTVADSVFRNPFRKAGIDSYAIYNSAASHLTLKGNELIDLPDGLQNGPAAGGNNYYIDNEIYHTSASYTDCTGNFTPTGACSCAEGMAVVSKGPAAQPMSYIQRNLIWGFKPSDQTCAGTGAPGSTIDLGSSAAVTKNFTITDNVILNAGVPYNIYFGAYIQDIIVSRNYVSGGRYGITNLYGVNMTITDNVYYNNSVRDYSTSASARNNTYTGNRTTGTSQLCVTTHHLTAPQNRCVPY